MTLRRGRSTTTGFLREFREFALTGNVVELATAVIIGVAFGKIITSFTNDIIMPLINPLIPAGDWRELTIAPGIRIGSFLGSIVDFLIVALALFLFIRFLKNLQKPRTSEPLTERECPYCLTTVPIAARRCRACASDLAPLDPLT